MDFSNLDFIRGNIVDPPKGYLNCFIVDDEGNRVPDNFGFKIVLGIPGKMIESKCTDEKAKGEVMCLTSWYIFQEPEEIVGTLHDSTFLKAIDRNHRAGIIIKHVRKNVFNTTKGTYCLLGPPRRRRNKIEAEINKQIYDLIKNIRKF